MMLEVIACPLTSIDMAIERAAMIATILEIIRVYCKSDRGHETIAPFLTVRMRTASNHGPRACPHPRFHFWSSGSTVTVKARVERSMI
jgi:hypothetical protein